MQHFKKDDSMTNDIKKSAITKDVSNKTSRRSARIVMMQSLYHRQLNEMPIEDIIEYINLVYSDPERYGCYLKIPADMRFVEFILLYAVENFNQVLELYREYSFRQLDKITYVEKSILVVAATELLIDTTDIKVIINEAIEVAKTHGGSDSYIFINSILHKLAVKLRV